MWAKGRTVEDDSTAYLRCCKDGSVFISDETIERIAKAVCQKIKGSTTELAETP